MEQLAMFARLALLGAALATTGCHGSRWARDDPDYEAKYPQHTDNVLKTAKQAIDARHVKGKSGPYAGLSGRVDPFALGGEAGMFTYPTSYVELRGGLAGLVYEGDAPVSGGVLGGVRLQMPSRLAPFVGLSAYGGMTPDFSMRDDGVDNNYNGRVDDPSETDDDFIGALLPEAGVHFWLTPEWRVTASADYLATTSGADFPLYSISLAWLRDPGGPTTDLALAKAAADGGWKVGDAANSAEYRVSSAPPTSGFENACQSDEHLPLPEEY